MAVPDFHPVYGDFHILPVISGEILPFSFDECSILVFNIAK